MDKDQLVLRKQQTQTQFDNITAKKNELIEEIQNTDIEIYRLQGEARLLNELIGQNAAPDPATTISVPDEAEVIA